MTLRPSLSVRLLLFILMSVSAAAAAADSSLEQAQTAQLESLRKEVAGQLQLQAYDLVDELVYGWTERPPFVVDTPVVLADVSVPVGFGSGLQALIENHFASLLIKNSHSHVILSHCPQCTSVVVHSGPKGTVVSRGADAPEALASAGIASGSRRALFLDFEIEGSALVLRARITSLEPTLPIVYARTLTTSTSSAALLRSEDHLKSAEEARKEYLDLLQGKGALQVPLRLGIRSYAAGDGAVSLAVPFVWIQLGVEVALSQSRAWTAAASVGFSWAPSTHQGYLANARFSRLLTGQTTSLSHPDLYAFLGASAIEVRGPDALAFQPKTATTENILAAVRGTPPEMMFASFEVGLTLKVKNRIGVSVYLEDSPALNQAPSIGKIIDLGVVQFHSFGAEVSVCF